MGDCPLKLIDWRSSQEANADRCRTKFDAIVRSLCAVYNRDSAVRNRSEDMLRSVRLTVPVALVFVVIHASGCGNAVDVHWPAGTFRQSLSASDRC